MKNKSLLLVFTLVLLGACSNPTAYQVNPKPDEPTEQQEVPESQQEGYMRIIGDLRWDKYLSATDWVRDFPKCVVNKYKPESSEHWIPALDYTNTTNCAPLQIGGINLYVDGVVLGKNSGTKSGWMTSTVNFRIDDISQSRAFSEAIKQKYDINIDETERIHKLKGQPANQSPVYCSKYTCWDLGTSDQRATPTLYTISILDKVKVNSSEF